MKRHYSKTDAGYRCVSCRQEFAEKEDLGKHYTLLGKCVSPVVLGMTLDLTVSHRFWVKAA